MALFDRSETKAFANCVSTTRQWRFRNASSAKQWSFMRSPTRHNGRHDGVRDDRYFMDRSRPYVFRFHKFRQKSFDEISLRSIVPQFAYFSQFAIILNISPSIQLLSPIFKVEEENNFLLFQDFQISHNEEERNEIRNLVYTFSSIFQIIFYASPPSIRSNFVLSSNVYHIKNCLVSHLLRFPRKIFLP